MSKILSRRFLVVISSNLSLVQPALAADGLDGRLANSQVACLAAS